ncbi:MAG: molybdenum cofactor biosynthesis protein MoaE [OM182 bacterium MED-G24]|uniref:Molybdopterin synthase catalytic subunit n=1 Tax=OM182 bacterium MED-G24 TaxID=1986255 RepID=A0A2A5WTR7_9GAMM|nr:MAG: molybdenum cofactor biosynthesis protein MoaE [OM182 bacterium MED-G24]
MSVRVQESDFDVSDELKALRGLSPRIGGIATFLGLVRDLNDNADVSGLFLEHYPGMTEKQILQILQEADQRWNVIGATVMHRIGQLSPLDQIVFVAVASEHRGDAFTACEFVIDYLKTRATFWKKETTPEGDRWLVTRDTDVAVVDAWQEKLGDDLS